MNKIGKAFFATALLYGLLGLGFGLYMAINQDHGQMPTHAHIQVIGWVSFAIFGLFYATYGAHVSPVLAKIHLILAQISMVGMAIGLSLTYGGKPDYEPIAAASAVLYALSFIVFTGLAISALKKA